MRQTEGAETCDGFIGTDGVSRRKNYDMETEDKNCFTLWRWRPVPSHDIGSAFMPKFYFLTQTGSTHALIDRKRADI